MNRILERCIKECKCIDLESLCVIAEKQVCSYCFESVLSAGFVMERGDRPFTPYCI